MVRLLDEEGLLHLDRSVYKVKVVVADPKSELAVGRRILGRRFELYRVVAP